MLTPVMLKIDEIYVPAERRKELDPDRSNAIADKIMEGEDQTPIQVRQGKGRYVLIKGVNRLEARKALGDTSIQAYIVSARRH